MNYKHLLSYAEGELYYATVGAFTGYQGCLAPSPTTKELWKDGTELTK